MSTTPVLGLSTPSDWPDADPIDLAIHDLPHASSTLEWWYVNGHARTDAGRELSLFASFFRTAIRRHEQTGAWSYAGALTWALVDPAARRYVRESLVDQHAPEIVHGELEQGLGIADPMLRRALMETVAKGSIPLPDLRLDTPCLVETTRLSLDYGGRRLEKQPDGDYVLQLCDARGETGCDLRFRLTKPVVRHGAEGVVQGKAGEQMFYYFSPRASLQGTLTLDGKSERIVEGSAWYDHEFGTSDDKQTRAGAVLGTVSWDWLSVQFEQGWELTIYCMVD